MLTNTTIETVDRYWASFIGCTQETLQRRQTLVVPHAGLGNYHGLFVFLRDALLLVSVPPSLLAMFQDSVEGWTRVDVLEEGRLRGLVGSPVEAVIGPAFVGYTDDGVFRGAPAGDTCVLGSPDLAALDTLRAACGALEWEHGGSQLGNQPLVGVYVEKHLVAVAGYELWGGEIAHMAVITHPRYRGQGYGKAVVSRLTAEVLSRGLVPQYRTLESNGASLAIARTLGFEHYATTVAVRLT